MDWFFDLLQRRHGLFVLGAMLLGTANAAWLRWGVSNLTVTLVVVCLVVLPALVDIYTYTGKVLPTRGRLIAWALIINLVYSPLLALVVAKVFWPHEGHLASGLALMSVVPCSAMILPLVRRIGGHMPMIMSLTIITGAASALVGLPVLLPLMSADHLRFAPGDLALSIGVVFVLPLALALLFKYAVLHRLSMAVYQAKVEPWLRRIMGMGMVVAGFAVMSLHYDIALLVRPGWLLWNLAAVLLYLIGLAALSGAVARHYQRKGMVQGDQAMSFALAMASRNVNVCIGLVLSGLYSIDALLVMPPLFGAYALQAALMPWWAGYLARRLDPLPRPGGAIGLS